MSAAKPLPLDASGARAAAFALLARKAWTERELTFRLRRRGASEGVARQVVADLVARGYVDDAGFARAWAESRARGRKIGRVRLGRELAARGVAAGLVTAAIEAAFGEVGERARAREAAARRLPALERARPERVFARLRDFLLRRGYPAAIVTDTVRALVGPVGPTGDGAPDDSV